jgi:hypothetical protein
MVLKKAIFLCREYITRLKIHVFCGGILGSNYLNILNKELSYTRLPTLLPLYMQLKHGHG